MGVDGLDWVEARAHSEVAFLFRWFVSITQPSPLRRFAKGLTHLRTRETRYRATSLLERFNREMRAREGMGAVWTVHNLLVLLQLRGVPA